MWLQKTTGRVWRVRVPLTWIFERPNLRIKKRILKSMSQILNPDFHYLLRGLCFSVGSVFFCYQFVYYRFSIWLNDKKIPIRDTGDWRGLSRKSIQIFFNPKKLKFRRRICFGFIFKKWSNVLLKDPFQALYIQDSLLWVPSDKPLFLIKRAFEVKYGGCFSHFHTSRSGLFFI